MAAKTLTGARAKMYVNNKLVGIFESCSYNMSIGTEPIFLLGRYGADEIVPTSYEAVSINCSGFRVVGAGPHTGSASANNAGVGVAATAGPAVPMLQDLLNLEAVTLAIVDRKDGTAILTAIGCIPNSYNGNHNAKATSKVTINYTGLRLSDESGPQDEGGAVSLP